MLPFDHNRLTDPEQALQHEQEKRNCYSCVNLQIHKRGGARCCSEAHDTAAVIAGEIQCEDYR